MIDALRELVGLAQAIVGFLVVGDIFLAILIWLWVRPLDTDPDAPNALTESAPTNDPDAIAKRRKEAAEEAEAWADLQNYSASDAYGGGKS